MNDWFDAETRVERALQLTDEEQWQEALKEIEAAIAINPNDAAWHAQRGQILDQLELYDEAVEAFKQAVKLEPEDAELSALLGVDLIRTDRFEEAIALYEQIARIHPDYEPSYCHRVAAYTRLGEHEAAEHMFYLAQQIDDECPNCYYNMGESLACRGLMAKAIYCWEKALELVSDYPHARRRIAEAYRAQDMHEEARESYLTAIRSNPGDADLLADYADLLVEMDELQAAAGKFQHVLDLDPNSARANIMLGLLASQDDKPEKAIEFFRAALVIEEDYPGLHSHMGEAELRLGRHDRAIEHLTMALDEDPNDCLALLAMGNCLLELLRPAEAANYFLRALKIDADLVGVHHNLAVCRFLEGKFDEGIEHCVGCLRVDPNHVMAMHKLAIAYLHIGRWADAQAVIARGLAIEPQHNGLKALPRHFLPWKLKHSLRRFHIRMPH
jgi:tetratricopeptide (TPR) repeat protein